MTANADWKHSLAQQLNPFICEAWLDYQSSLSFRMAWSIGGAKQGPIVARIERDVAKAVPDRIEFLDDLCFELAWQFCFLMSPAFVSKSRSSVADTVLDGLATALGSVQGYSKSINEAKRQLHEIADHFPRIVDDLEKDGRRVDFLSYSSSDKIAALLTASSLREGFLLPLFSSAATLLTAFEGFETEFFNRQIREFVEETLKTAKLAPSNITPMLEEVERSVQKVRFNGAALQRREDVLRAMRSAAGDPRYCREPSSVAQKSEHETIIAHSTLAADLDQTVRELTEMIGLGAVKREIISLTNYIKVQRLRAARNLKSSPISLHLVFSGSPGTGKTTVARIVARLYKALGVLSSGHLVETDRSGLVAGYVGQTATTTKKVVESALDGVLFIDEAYSLVKDAPWDFGPEAIETLLKLMEDHRERLVVIVAGYSDPMADFIRSNPGLQSRFTRRIEFEDYSAKEMLQIFEKRAADHSFRVTPTAADVLLQYFATVEGDDGFGNGRGVRNTFEKVTVRHADRVAALQNPSDYDLTTLNEEDVNLFAPLLNSGSEASIVDAALRHDLKLDLGDRVFHQKFGYGSIISIDGSKLRVEFEGAGTKTVVDSFVARA